MILGITGGLATGKTTAAGYLALHGAHTIDCDELARHFTSCDSAVLTAIELQFGGAVFHRSGSLNRQQLAEVVFSDEKRRKELEAILHPRISGVLFEMIRWARVRSQPLVLVIPLLFESGWEQQLDAVLTISCEPDIQLARAVRRGLSPEQASLRISAQIPLLEKERRSDFVVHNNGSQEALRSAVLEIWDGLREETCG